MIEITFAYSVKPDAPPTDINTAVGTLSLTVYDEMHAVLKSLINGNVILNCCTTITNENNQFFLSHFATTPENAQLFLNEYTETTAWWDQRGIEFKISQKEIDFDTVDNFNLIKIFDDNDILYGLKTLERTISSPSRTLAT